MAKLTAWVVTVLGVLLILQAGGWVSYLDSAYPWFYAIGVLVVGLGKLYRNYKKK